MPHYSKEPKVSVGIVGGEHISFSLDGPYLFNDTPVSGAQEVEVSRGLIRWRGRPYTGLRFAPVSAESSFSLDDVVIGVSFHWERKERQTFRGALHLMADGGKVWAVNELPVEQYLESVISSEMSATSNMPLLMAHAVISRSWLMRQMEAPPRPAPSGEGNKTPSCLPLGMLSPSPSGEGRGGATTSRIIRWYDHTDHTLFDVCADDHCQRYQGITMETSANAAEAVRRTRGQVLAYDGEICDARFSKCCGGAMEEFQYCWADDPKPYLRGIGDNPSETLPDLTVEANARQWILSEPESFCNTRDKRILGQVLNSYDQETTDFYRWHVDYTREELSALIRRKSGVDFGQILDLVPMRRGTSGRISELKIVGTRRTMAVGKELEIRRLLSESHLYSSAFVTENTPDGFRLIGAGWGHGVGLCQIGAAVMGDKGYSYEEILRHYYPNSTIQQAW